MEEGGRRNKGGKKAASGKSLESPKANMYERRPLKCVALNPPDYKISPQVLIESYIEKAVQFAGVVPNIPVELDITNRSAVLQQVDRAKREEHIPWHTTYENDVVFCLSAHNVKISKRDGQEELLQRIPIHEIAAICYVTDDDHHMLAIKFMGEDDLPESAHENMMCQLAVLYCDSRGGAEELCSLIGQCFQLVYTEATMQFLDNKLSEAAMSMSIASSMVVGDRSCNSSPRRETEANNLAFLSQSSLELDKNTGSVSVGTTRSLPSTYQRNSGNQVQRSDSELSAAACDLIQEYMDKLQTKLNPDELRQFAKLLKAWHTNLPFPEFCDKVLELYGPNRKHMLAGMQPFIPEKDAAYFENFLERIGLAGTTDASLPVSRGYRRWGFGSTGVADGGSIDDYDRALNAISHEIENMGSSVNLNTNVSDTFLPKST